MQQCDVICLFSESKFLNVFWQDGKSHSAVMASSVLVFCGLLKNAQSALELFRVKRTPLLGINQSQIR